MKYFHLCEKGKGLELELLGDFVNFDGADEEAQKRVADDKVKASVWILDEPGVAVLSKSIADGGAFQRLQENFIQEHLKIAEGSTLFGIKVQELDRESLMAAAMHGYKSHQDEMKRHGASVELLASAARCRHGSEPLIG